MAVFSLFTFEATCRYTGSVDLIRKPFVLLGRLKGLIFNLFDGVLNRHRYPVAVEINHPSKTIWITFFIFCTDILLAAQFS